MKICETSLRWILNIRVNKSSHKYHLDKIEDIDGHTMNSMLWTIEQCKNIDLIGLDKWLQSTSAKGYGDYLSNQNGFYRSSTEITDDQFNAISSKCDWELK